MTRQCYECKSNIDNRSSNGKGMTCFMCDDDYHVKCCKEVSDEDFAFYKTKASTGFHWFCKYCNAKAARFCGARNVRMEQEELMESFKNSLKEMETKVEKLSLQKPYANIVKETIKEVRNEEKVDMVQVNSMQKQIRTENVLVIKPNNQANKTEVKNSVENLKKSLQTSKVPLTSFRESARGTIVMKFPNAENKSKAEKEINATIRNSDSLKLSEPAKILPKMAIVNVPRELDDGFILNSIKNKNQNIAELVNAGEELGVVAQMNSMKNSLYKTVIIKVSANIRKCIINQGNYLFVDLNRCKVYDNIWVRRCFHCQEYGHNANSCQKKNENPVCGFCSQEHNSKDCRNKNSLKCVNCLRAGKDSTNHSVTDRDCPILNHQKNLVVDNTDYSCSKNE